MSETIQLAAGNNYALTLDDATNAAGLTVDASALGAANRLTLDGAAETASALTATGGAGDDATHRWHRQRRAVRRRRQRSADGRRRQ